MRYLTLFTIGPVQGFIAQARKLQDLYAGSFLLSYLAKQTMAKAQKLGADILFPDPEQESAPNRFLMMWEVGNEYALCEICRELDKYVRGEWEDIARKVIKETKFTYTGAISAQISSLIQVYYASELYKGDESFGECYKNVMKRLGAAKTFRTFTQLDEPPGRKCSVSYEHNAIFYRDDPNNPNKKKSYLVPNANKVTGYNVGDLNKYIQPDETLGAVTFVKRCLRFAIPEFNDNFPPVSDIYKMYGNKLDEDDDKHGYYAVVMFDGDNMGLWYSEPDIHCMSKIREFQAYLSGKISEFAALKSYAIVDWEKRQNGVVVYAGGEDFLGVLNLQSAFSTLCELRKAFGEIDISAYTDKKLTFSAGIVIAHIKTPLSEVLGKVREAEHKAKTFYSNKKDAYCLTIIRHNGEMTEFIQPFYYDDTASLEILDTLVETLVCDGISPKFIFQLGEELARIAETSQSKLHKEIFLVEARRLIENSEFTDIEQKEAIVEKIYGKLELLAKSTEFDLKNLLMFLRGIAFIARERGAEQ